MIQRLICLAASLVILASIGMAEIPSNLVAAQSDQGQRDALYVRNYDTGASFTEAYSQVERLSRNTQVTTRSFGTDSVLGGGLEASINSQVIGRAHIAWQSSDPGTMVHGRHPLTGRSVEDLTGIFSIEKFISLWSDSPPGDISVDWLPCS